jgi:arginase
MSQDNHQRQADKPVQILAAQGWTCDRSSGGMRAAARLGRMLSTTFGLPLDIVGTPLPPVDLNWDKALERGRPAFEAARDGVERILKRGGKPLNILNKCGTSHATLPPIFAARPDAVLVWCDAHADYNTPDITETGYLGGLVIAALTGRWNSGYGAGLTPDRAIVVGARDIDVKELELMKRDGVHYIAPKDGRIDVAAVRAAIAGRPLVFHLDCDLIDPGYVPAEYRVPNGIHPDNIVELASSLAADHEIVAVEITEFEAPELDTQATEAVATIARIVSAIGFGRNAAQAAA